MKTAFLSGISGQDGSYMAELLLSKGYEVHGLIRRSSSFNTSRIDHIFDRLHLHHGDLTDALVLTNLLYNIQPDEIYHLGAQSHVRVSFEVPGYTGEATGMGTTSMLEAMRKACPISRFYQASSSEMFGMVQEVPQKETTPFYPRSPYGVAKVYAYWMTVNYRESYGLHASNGILFNHESPRRGETFVTRKITRAIARIKAGLQEKLVLGNLDAKRDWGYAPDYVEGMWRMLQVDEPSDYVLATGETHSVREFLEEAFSLVNLDWKEYVTFDEAYMRPSEVDLLIGDYSKAKRILNWEPTVKFKELVGIMVRADQHALAKQLQGLEVR